MGMVIITIHIQVKKNRNYRAKELYYEFAMFNKNLSIKMAKV